MLTATLKREMEMVVEAALMLSEPGTPESKIAERLYDSEPDLVERITRPVIIERFLGLIKRRRQHTPTQNQMLLPGFPHLPQRIRIKTGQRPLLMKATLPELKQYRQILLKRKRVRLAIVEKLIAFMTPFTEKHPRITVMDLVLKENFPKS